MQKGRGYKYNVETVAGVELASTLEGKVARQLESANVKWEYEPYQLDWIETVPGYRCENCGSKEVAKRRRYTPDFVVGRTLVIEVKGRLTRRDRKIILGVKKANPELDYRLIFDKDNKISKTSKTRYSDWAQQHGFIYSLEGEVPKAWITQ